MKFKKVIRAIKAEGEITIKNYFLVWDGFGVEVCKDDEYIDTFSSNWELEEFLLDEGLIEE
jgi:hypothetical protein